MDLAGLALIITASTGLLGLLGAGLWKVITLILTAYKDQAASTIAAKDGELAAKDAQIARHQNDITFLKEKVLGRLEGLR